MENKKISNPKIDTDTDIEEDDRNSILYGEIKAIEVDRLRKRVNFLTFFIIVLLCGFIAAVYFNLKKMMTDVRNEGEGTIASMSVEIESKLSVLSALHLDFKKDILKKVGELQKKDSLIESGVKNNSVELKKIATIEKDLKKKLDQENLGTLEKKFVSIIDANSLAIKEELKKVIEEALADKLTKKELEEQIGALQKYFRIKLFRIAEDTESMIENAKKNMDTEFNKKSAILIKDFEISMKKYFEESIKKMNNEKVTTGKEGKNID